MRNLGLWGCGIVGVGLAALTAGCSGGEGTKPEGRREATATTSQALVAGFDVRFRLTEVIPGGIASPMGNIIDTGPMVTTLGGVKFPPNPGGGKFFACGIPGAASCSFYDQPHIYPDPTLPPPWICPNGSISPGKCAYFPDVFANDSFMRTTRVAASATTVPLKVTFTNMTHFAGGLYYDSSITLNVNLATGTTTPVLPTGDPVLTNIVGDCAIVQNGAVPESKICFKVDVTPRTCGNPGSDTTCDSIDDDCDLVFDEDPFPTGVSCGVGACAVAETTTCGGTPTCTALPTPPQGDASCDGVDDDCDGDVDEDCDRDGDGLTDRWETVGIDGDGMGGPDFVLAGADPLKPDIYVEMDAMDCVAGAACAVSTGPNDYEHGVHDHTVTTAAIQQVIDRFADQGITLHADIDEKVPHVEKCCFGNQMQCAAAGKPACFHDMRVMFFGTAAERAAGPAVLAAKAKAYRYALWGHRQDSVASGVAYGSNLLISAFYSLVAPNGPGDNLAETFMHELGHTLGLGHGGAYEDTTNLKPNYLSIMNYTFNGGIDNLGKLDYSHGLLADLTEKTGVDEAVGIHPTATNIPYGWVCPSAMPGDGRRTGRPAMTFISFPFTAPAVDWNCNKVIPDPGLFVGDINGDHYCILSGIGKPLASTAASTDVRMGGTIVPQGFVTPGGDLRLYSKSKCDGVAMSDFLDTTNPAVGEVVRAGADGTLETKICYVGVLNDDILVNKLVASDALGIRQMTIDSRDVIVRDVNNVITEVLPGTDDELQTVGVSGLDRFAPFLILPGADKVFNSKYVSPGVAATDTAFQVFLATDDGEIQSGTDGSLETSVVSPDVVIDAYIADGPDRKCDSVMAAGDRLDFTNARQKDSVQTEVLKDHDDWSNLKFAFEAWNPMADVFAPIDPSMDDLVRARKRRNRADLSLGVTPSATQTAKGGTVSFHVTLTNAGPAEALEGSVELRLPAGKTFASCSSSTGRCTRGNRGLLQVESLAVGASVSADFVVEVSCSDAAGLLTVSASAQSLSSDSNLANNVATASTTITAPVPVFGFVPADVTTNVCSGVQLGTPVATNVCGTAVTLTSNAPATFPLGRTVVTWTATSGGPSVTATQAVTASLGDSASCCPAGSHVMLGTPSNDTLNGTAGVDCMVGLGGQDRLNGAGGDDIISGGAGDDIIDGGAGNDRIYGGTGQDTLTGAAGNDLLEGNDGDDICRGGAGNDVLVGGPGQDQLFGEDNDDTLRGDAGTDTLEGGTGNDYLEGDLGTDTCRGGTGTNQFVSCEVRPDAPAAIDACTNGVRDGGEATLDCGGSGCVACTGGLSCASTNDCASGVCSAGVCGPVSSPLVTSLVVTSDWGAGYCMAVSATNRGLSPTTSWSFKLDTKQSTIYQTTKATFTPATGIVRGTPQASESVIAPGATNSQVAFCANRTGGNTTALAALFASGVTY